MMERRSMRHAVVTAVLALLVWPTVGPAQYVRAPAPAAYALENVTVVRADGRHTPGMTVVVRGEFIEAISRDAAVPADARVLEGDTLYVYPGLIDAAGSAKLELPEPQTESRDVRSWAPPRDVQGFTPHRRAIDYLAATGQDFGRQRQRGVVALAVHPHETLMGGQSALLILRPGAGTANQLVARPVLGPAMAFRGGRGAYPSTLFGMMAFMRQSFEDAGVYVRRMEAQERDPRGVVQPAFDPDHAVLAGALNGGAVVYFAADGAEDIRRVLQLASEYGFRPVIVGGRDAWRVADLLRSRNVPVIASVDFGTPQRWKPDTGDEESEEELDPAVLREKRSFEDRYSNAGRLAAAGVRFALASGGSAVDLREGVRKAIEYGLSEADALRAVTTTPAELLGAAHLVRVEAGMPATFVVTSGPIFAKDTRVLYTFIEGELEENGSAGRPAAADADPDAPTADVGGTWEITFEVMDMRVTGRMRLSQDGESFSGDIVAEFGEVEIRDGVVTGNEIRFESIQMGQSTTFTGTVDGDNVSGSGSSPQIGTIRFTGRRTAPEEAVR